MVDPEDIEMLLEMTEEAMNHSVEHLSRELHKIRTGKASPAILDGIFISYYGVQTPLKQASTVTAQDSRTIVVQPFEKSIIGTIEKAIMESNLGLNPQNDGERILLPIPVLTEERRKKLARQASDEGENAKIGIRSARREAMDDIKKAVKDGLPEDAGKTLTSKVEDLTKSFIGKIDAAVKKKEGDIMQV